MPKGVYVRTEIARRNNSLGHKGIITWMKGKHHTEITKEKMRLAHLDQRPTQKCIDASRRVHTKNRKCSVDGCRNKHEGLGFCKWHYQRLPQVRTRMLVLVRKWQKENPKSNSHFSIELQIAMNNVRKRDNNTCKWSNCGLTNKETIIHVNHIFPRKEYPELELIESYMICYCIKHHKLWHAYRGDSYYKLISSGIEDVAKK